MKRISSFAVIFAALSLVCSCSLTYDNVVMQVMRRSHSGLDLRHKSMAAFVIYKDAEDSVACSRAMFDFISNMSSEYNEDIDMYTIPYSDDVDYADKKTAADLLTEASVDVVFISVPLEKVDDSRGYKVYVYDGMSDEDVVLATPRFKQDSIFVSSATKQLAALFGPNWSTGVFRILLYENQEDWLEAYLDAREGKWTSAMEKWMKILEKTKSIDKRAAAEYNISLGCYLTGNIQLAEKWLAQAVADCGSTRTPDYMTNLKVLINKEK